MAVRQSVCLMPLLLFDAILGAWYKESPWDPPITRAMQPRPIILLVDDDPKVLKLLDATLRLRDYEVVRAEDAPAALSWLETHRPDLIISDIVMPGMDGWELFQHLRAGAETRTVPFIFLSARSGADDVVRGLRLGADEFLRKPFAIEEVLVRVERVLEARGANRPRGDFDGDLSKQPLADLVNQVGIQHRTGALVLNFPGESVDGGLWFREGVLVHAELGLLVGRPALFQMLVRNGGTFRYSGGDRGGLRTVEGPTLAVLMEGFRHLDEGNLSPIDPFDTSAVDEFSRQMGALSTPPFPGASTSQEIFVPRTGARAEPLPWVEGSGSMSSRIPSLPRPGTRPEPQSSGEFVESPPSPPRQDTAEMVAVEAFSATDEFQSLSSDDREKLARDIDAEWSRSGLLAEERTDPAVTSGSRPSRNRLMPFLPPPPPPETREEEVSGLRSLEISQDLSPSSQHFASTDTAITLVDETPGPVERLFQSLRTVMARASLPPMGIQISTRSGRVLASSLPTRDKREHLSLLGAHALRVHRSGTDVGWTQLCLGDLHLLVLELPYHRLLTCISENPVEPRLVVDLVRDSLS